MLPEAAVEPPDPLYRVGWPPDPLAWPDWRFVGRNRFDAPDNAYRVLYLAERRLTCFAELLARYYLKDPQLIALLRAMPSGADVDAKARITSGTIAPGFFSRPIGALRLASGQQWLDLRSVRNRAALYDLLIEGVDRRGLGSVEIDLSDVTSRNRDLTRFLSGWAFGRGFNGIAYTSRLACGFDCWAIFEGARFTPDRRPVSLIAKDDPDLRQVVEIFGLTIP